MKSKRVLTAVAAGAALTLGGLAGATSADAAVTNSPAKTVHPAWCFGGGQAGDATTITVYIDKCTDIVDAVAAQFHAGYGMTGHFEFFGPNNWHFSTNNQYFANGQWTPDYNGPGQTRTGDLVCERFWQSVPGGYVQIGGNTCWKN